jgi:hypothetical protein
VPREPHAVHYTQPELVAGLVRELVSEEEPQRGDRLRRRLARVVSPGRDDVTAVQAVES